MQVAMRAIKRVRGKSYLRSLRNSILALSDVCEEFHRRDCGEMGTLAWWRVIQVYNRVGTLLGFSVRDDEFLQQLVGRFRAIEDTSHIIPR